MDLLVGLDLKHSAFGFSAHGSIGTSSIGGNSSIGSSVSCSFCSV